MRRFTAEICTCVLGRVLCFVWLYVSFIFPTWRCRQLHRTCAKRFREQRGLKLLVLQGKPRMSGLGSSDSHPTSFPAGFIQGNPGPQGPPGPKVRNGPLGSTGHRAVDALLLTPLNADAAVELFCVSRAGVWVLALLRLFMDNSPPPSITTLKTPPSSPICSFWRH